MFYTKCRWCVAWSRTPPHPDTIDFKMPNDGAMVRKSFLLSTSITTGSDNHMSSLSVNLRHSISTHYRSNPT